MKLHFDSSQQYQLDAIASITDLFRGNSKGHQREEFLSTGASSANTQLFGTNMIVRNVLSLGTDDILVNIGEVQKRNNIPANIPPEFSKIISNFLLTKTRKI